MSSNIVITKRDQEQILIRAELSKAKKAFDIIGLAAPKPKQRVESGDQSAMWMSPDEVLLFVNKNIDIEAFKKALPKSHLAHDVTGARVVFTLEGAHLKDVFRKGSPRDIDKLPLNEVVRTRLGQIAVAFWFLSDEKAELVCFRSVADYVENWLSRAAQPGSLPVLG